MSAVLHPRMIEVRGTTRRADFWTVAIGIALIVVAAYGLVIIPERGPGASAFLAVLGLGGLGLIVYVFYDARKSGAPLVRFLDDRIEWTLGGRRGGMSITEDWSIRLALDHAADLQSLKLVNGAGERVTINARFGALESLVAAVETLLAPSAAAAWKRRLAAGETITLRDRVAGRRLRIFWLAVLLLVLLPGSIVTAFKKPLGAANLVLGAFVILIIAANLIRLIRRTGGGLRLTADGIEPLDRLGRIAWTEIERVESDDAGLEISAGDRTLRFSRGGDDCLILAALLKDPPP